MNKNWILGAVAVTVVGLSGCGTTDVTYTSGYYDKVSFSPVGYSTYYPYYNANWGYYNGYVVGGSYYYHYPRYWNRFWRVY